ncbi:MAG TPA: hypothetical protein VKN18_28730 [Blastocatellia bacterium]|nr:hypothetical protein [Blastocatellia bacterium]
MCARLLVVLYLTVVCAITAMAVQFTVPGTRQITKPVTASAESSVEYIYSSSEQRSDPEFNARVALPSYNNKHPRVLFDEAHNNDTSSGRYKPFTDLITSDGYRVTTNSTRFSSRTLKDYQILVIVNASGPSASRDASAFTEEECDVASKWVNDGGSLLLITDQAPYSTAVAELAKRFAVDLTKGYTVEPVHFNKESSDQTEIVFTREEGLVGDHAITNGRDPNERINRVICFTGTSLKGPEGSVSFLKLASTAMDVLPPERKATVTGEASSDHRPVTAAGRAIGVAFGFGKGRIVVFTEAAMLTAQVTPGGIRFGMNFGGTDNRQLALNTMHWLSRLLN